MIDDGVDWNAVRARIEVVADALRLRDAEVDAAAADEEGLIAFARRHNQSLDWLVVGDVRTMIAARAPRRDY
jgi:hypothetical protein